MVGDFCGELGLEVVGGFCGELGLGVVSGCGGEFNRERCGAVIVGASLPPPNWKG